MEIVLIELPKDHPHACGDKIIKITESEVNNRIIPTRVGTRVSSTTGRLEERDHPHACGDKLYRAKAAASVIGSSPRVWGQAVPCSTELAAVRIIPTRVGTRITVTLKTG